MKKRAIKIYQANEQSAPLIKKMYSSKCMFDTKTLKAITIILNTVPVNIPNLYPEYFIHTG